MVEHGDGGQSSLLTHSIYLLGGGAMVERLRTLWSSDKSMAALSVEPPLSNKSLRAVERAFI